MTRGRFYSVAMPIAAIVYVIVGIIAHSSNVWGIGALAFAIIAVAGTAFSQQRR